MGAQIEFRCNNVAIEMVRNGKWPFGNQTSRKLDFHQQPNWLCASWKQFELDSSWSSFSGRSSGSLNIFSLTSVACNPKWRQKVRVLWTSIVFEVQLCV